MKIFYSWQSDTPGNTGHYLIRDALQGAINELASDLALEEAERPELDHDTKGLLGAPGIADAILAKIDDCDVFVADITLVGKTEKGKALINSNVATELGYAHKAKGHEALIMVMNTAYGGPDSRPFNIQHRRWPVLYSLSDDADKSARTASEHDLIKKLKPILREYLKVSNARVEIQPFQAQPITVSPAHYFDLQETIIPPDLGRNWKELRCRNPLLLYLRIHPSKVLPDLTEREAGSLLWEHSVGPLRSGSGYSDARNRYGGITYHGDREAGEVVTATQLFRSREIWGFDASILTKRTSESRTGNMVPYIPSQAHEEIIAHGLGRYLKFLRDVLECPLPMMVEAGASNVEGFYMAMGSNFYEPLWGPVHRQHIQKRSELVSWDDGAVNDVLLGIFEEFFDAVGAQRPPHLNGFPPKQEVAEELT